MDAELVGLPVAFPLAGRVGAVLNLYLQTEACPAARLFYTATRGEKMPPRAGFGLTRGKRMMYDSILKPGPVVLAGTNFAMPFGEGAAGHFWRRDTAAEEGGAQTAARDAA